MLAFGDEVGDGGEGGLGCAVGFGFGGCAEVVDGGADVGECFGDAGGDAFELLFGGVGVGMQDGAGGGGLDGDAAEVVCGGVVEFAGDAGAFVGEECLAFCLSKAAVAEDNVAGDDADDEHSEASGCAYEDADEWYVDSFDGHGHVDVSNRAGDGVYSALGGELLVGCGCVAYGCVGECCNADGAAVCSLFADYQNDVSHGFQGDTDP